ncbi:MAG TPA: alpha/beta hydrolase [Allosphingosinicella sp.]|jgi:pimeloyl-ACP methyl ester carboxylesterase
MKKLLAALALLGAWSGSAQAAQPAEDQILELCTQLYELGAAEPLPEACADKIVAIDAGPGIGVFPKRTPPPVIADPPRDAAFPARNRQLLVPSRGEGMNALFFLAAGEGPHPTMLLLHGLPGNERNLDLAQAVRRAGWNVLTFTYRGAWGSPGRFSIAGAIEDTDAAMAFLSSADAARDYGIDPRRLVIAGHSMGGLAAALHAARAQDVAALVLLDAWNAGATGEELASGGAAARKAFEQGFDDLGNALQGATVSTLYDELIARRSEWKLPALAPRLAGLPVLTVYATHGGAAENKALADAIRAAGAGRLTAVELDSDHSFADHRIALAVEVVRWLEYLAGPTGAAN